MMEMICDNCKHYSAKDDKCLKYPTDVGNVVEECFVPLVVRCKDCIHHGNEHKCILAFVASKQDFPVCFYDNRGEWFCADGVAK